MCVCGGRRGGTQRGLKLFFFQRSCRFLSYPPENRGRNPVYNNQTISGHWRGMLVVMVLVEQQQIKNDKDKSSRKKYSNVNRWNLQLISSPPPLPVKLFPREPISYSCSLGYQYNGSLKTQTLVKNANGISTRNKSSRPKNRNTRKPRSIKFK